jgi:hypothetical protein
MAGASLVTPGRRPWVGLGLAGLILAAALVVVLLRDRQVVARAGEDQARLRALEARVALLERRQRGRSFGTPSGGEGREPRLVVPMSPEEAASAGAGTAAAPAPVTLSTEAVLDEAAIQREYFGELDARLAAETRDPSWSAATEERLRGTTQDLRTLINVDSAQCGSSLCRVDTTVVQPQEEARALDRFLAATIAVLPDAVVREGDEPGRRIVYFSRTTGGLPPMLAPER